MRHVFSQTLSNEARAQSGARRVDIDSEVVMRVTVPAQATAPVGVTGKLRTIAARAFSADAAGVVLVLNGTSFDLLARGPLAWAEGGHFDFQPQQLSEVLLSNTTVNDVEVALVFGLAEPTAEVPEAATVSEAETGDAQPEKKSRKKS